MADIALPWTLSLIKNLHHNQFDKAGDPYWQHPLAVMRLLPPSASEDARHAALLHDVLEDTPTTEADLRFFGYSDRIVHIVRKLSRLPGDPGSYKDWIRSIAESGDLDVMLVKRADMQHNSDPVRRDRNKDEKMRTAIFQMAIKRWLPGIGIINAKLYEMGFRE